MDKKLPIYPKNFKREEVKNMIYLKDSKLKVGSVQETVKVFKDLLMLEDAIAQDREHFYVMHLDIRSRVKLVEVVSVGTMTSSLVHPRETFRRAIAEGAASIIIAHNHPSGEADPSDEDTKVTKLMFEAGQLLGITMLDHIVFSSDGYFSFRENRKY
jgi:DNA repair protein RadC